MGRGGRVLSLAIDRYVCVSVFDRSFDDRITTRFDSVETYSAAGKLGNPIARAALARLGRCGGLQIASHADSPPGSGLGGSGAFSVALLHALQAGAACDYDDRARLADLASELEMVDLGRSVGRHDHYMAAYGGLRDLIIGQEGRVEPRYIEPPPGFDKFVAERLLLFHIGGVRDAAKVLATQNERTQNGDKRVLEALVGIHELAHEAVGLVETAEYDALGELLHRHWQRKRALSAEVSNSDIDDLYMAALAAGASGGKLLGAGGGGFLLVYVPHERAAASVRKVMGRLRRRELTFRFSPHGVRATTLGLS
jgi:D-glycero-alpha-D-manno-heptose-7-phosphate kinase